MIGKTNSGGVMPTGSITLSANGTYNITNYSEAVVNVSSPVENQLKPFLEGTLSIISDTTISQLKKCAFMSESYTYISLPNLEVINEGAFSNCYGLDSVVHMEHLKYIGSRAFFISASNNNYITEFYGGSSISYVGMSAFASNKFLTHVDFLSMNLDLNIGPGAFYSCINLATPIICRPTSTIHSLVNLQNVPQISLTHSSRIDLSYYAFYQLSTSNIYISAPTIGLGTYAFAWCPGLTKIDSTIFNGVITQPNVGTQYMGSAFYYCQNLSYVDIVFGGYNANTVQVPVSCFIGCAALEFVSIIIDAAIYGQNNQYTNMYSTFSECLSLSYTQVTYSGRGYQEPYLNLNGTFAKCSNLEIFKTKYSYLNDTSNWIYKISVGANAFWNCHKLSYVPIVNGYIGGGGFANCYMLNSIFIKASYSYYTNLQANAITKCSVLSKIYIYNSFMCPLSASTFFNQSPFIDTSFLGYYGSIYVRQSLLTKYQSATNWVYFSDRFVGITDEEMEQAYQDYLSVGLF